MDDIVNTETHNWSQCRDKMTVGCSATIGTSVSPPYLQGSGTIGEKEQKDCKSKKTRAKQCFPERTRLRHASSHSSLGYLCKNCMISISQNSIMEGGRAQKSPHLNEGPLTVNGY